MTPPATNRSMFRRLIRRLLFANRGRLFVILLALSAGAAVSAALLNLQTDAKRRVATDFRAFGANALVVPRDSSAGTFDHATSATILDEIPGTYQGGEITKVGFIYVAVLAKVKWNSSPEGLPKPSNVILVGTDGRNVQRVVPSEYVATADRNRKDVPLCRVGATAAKHLGVQPRDLLQLHSISDETSCYISTIESFGSSEDSQIFTDWYTAARLAGPPVRISAVQLNVPGTPQQIQDFLTALQQKLPNVDVRPLRQFSEAQAKIYSRISGLLTAATTLILILTALCVMAAMTNIAAERKHDVGMMKAIGGSAHGILNLFLTEAALLGLAGGLIGAAAGIALSIALGKAVFGIAAAPRLIVYPISVALTVIVAIVGAYPLRRLANVRPATIFRGDA
jgi:putative ABC transport system permease protein